jgi:hypothetical protein
MTTSAHDPFSATFDSIEIDPSRTPSLSAIEHAFAVVTPSAAAPELETAGFYLVDDAGGRFEIDRDMGIISLRNESLLETERLAIHLVRMRVIERSGANYEMEMKLRLTGRVPQMVGAEDALFDIPATEATPVAKPEPQTHWTRFAAALAVTGKSALPAGAFVQPEYPSVSAVFTSFAISAALPQAFEPDAY